MVYHFCAMCQGNSNGAIDYCDGIIIMKDDFDITKKEGYSELKSIVQDQMKTKQPIALLSLTLIKGNLL